MQTESARSAAPPITWRGRFPGELLLRGTRSLLTVVELLGASADNLAHASNLGRHLILAKHPDLVRDVFVGQSRALVKGRGLQRLNMVLGNGLLTSEGELHLRQRRLVQPAFHRERIARYAETMVALTDETVRGWRDGEQRDIAQEMHRLTLDIVAKTLFDAELRGRAHEIGTALSAVLDAFTVLLIFVGDDLLRWPLPRMASACEPPFGVVLRSVMVSSTKSAASQATIARLLPGLKFWLFGYAITVCSRSSPRRVSWGRLLPM